MAITAAYFAGSNAAKADLAFDIIDLGANSGLTVNKEAMRVHLVSIPDTTQIDFHFSTDINWSKDLGKGCWPGCSSAARIEYGGNSGSRTPREFGFFQHQNPASINVHVGIDDLHFVVTNIADLKIGIGPLFDIDGAYGSFEFGWNQVNLTVTPDIRLDLRTPVYDKNDIFSINQTYGGNVNVAFILMTNRIGKSNGLSFTPGVGRAGLETKPYFGGLYSSNAFRVVRPSAGALSDYHAFTKHTWGADALTGDSRSCHTSSPYTSPCYHEYQDWYGASEDHWVVGVDPGDVVPDALYPLVGGKIRSDGVLRPYCTGNPACP